MDQVDSLDSKADAKKILYGFISIISGAFIGLIIANSIFFNPFLFILGRLISRLIGMILGGGSAAIATGVMIVYKEEVIDRWNLKQSAIFGTISGMVSAVFLVGGCGFLITVVMIILTVIALIIALIPYVLKIVPF